MTGTASYSYESPERYAKRLASYIASPTKIESLIKIEFGRAPPLHRIAQIRYEIERSRKHERLDLVCDDIEFPVEPEPGAAPDAIEFTPPEERENPFLSYNPCARVIASVAIDFKLAPEDITGHRRFALLIDARSVIATVLKRWGRKSYPEIGRMLGGRDHSTIINLVRKFDICAGRNKVAQQSFDRHLAWIEEARREIATRLQDNADASVAA